MCLKIMDTSKRFMTFNKKWPQTLKAIQLAEAGFCYLDFQDYVQCFTCKIVLKDWTPDDNPYRRHIQANPKCPFLLGKHKERIPFHITVMVPNMKELKARKASFIGCSDFIISTELLAKQGFFYTGIRNLIRCYLCGITLRTCNAIPLSEHEKISPHCPIPSILKHQSSSNLNSHLSSFCYPEMKWFNMRHLSFKHVTCPGISIETLVKQGFFYREKYDDICCYMCGESKFNWRISKKIALTWHSSYCLLPDILKQGHLLDEKNLCIICFENEKNIVSINCGHIAGCKKCIEKLEKCPMCRTYMTDKVQVFY